MAKAKVVQGQDRTITVQLVKESDGTPFSLEGFTGVTGYFPGADDAGYAKVGSLVSSDLGTVKFVLDETDTAALAAGEDQSFEVVLDQGSTRTIVQFDSKLDVFERLF